MQNVAAKNVYSFLNLMTQTICSKFGQNAKTVGPLATPSNLWSQHSKQE